MFGWGHISLLFLRGILGLIENYTEQLAWIIVIDFDMYIKNWSKVFIVICTHDPYYIDGQIQFTIVITVCLAKKWHTIAS